MIYGIDIKLEYKHVYCIYKHTQNDKCMNSLEYHQQYSRCRTAECVKIIDMNDTYDRYENKYMFFEDSVKRDNDEFRNFKRQHGKLCNKYDTLNEICTEISLGKVVIRKDHIFSKMFHYRSWYNRLFSYDKMQLLSKLGEEAGYEVEFKFLPDETAVIEKQEMDDAEKEQIAKMKEDGIKPPRKQRGQKTHLDPLLKGVGRAVNSEKHKIVDIAMRIMSKENVDDVDPVLIKHISEVMINRINAIDNEPISIPTLVNDKAFTLFIERKYLNKSRDEFNAIAIALQNKEIPIMANYNVLVKKIRAIESIEDIIGIDERFDIEAINDDINIFETKSKLLKQVPLLIYLFDGIESKKRLQSRMKNKINNIDELHQLKKFVADCYNAFGDVILFDTEKLDNIINGKRDRSMIYSNFRKYITEQIDDKGLKVKRVLKSMNDFDFMRIDSDS